MANKLYLARQAHPGFTLFCIEQILLGAYEATPRSAHGNNRPASSNSINDANISKGGHEWPPPLLLFCYQKEPVNSPLDVSIPLQDSLGVHQPLQVGVH